MNSSTLWIAAVGWVLGLPAVTGLIGHWFREYEVDSMGPIVFPLTVLGAFWPVLVWGVLLSWPFRFTHKSTQHNEVKDQ